MKRTGLAAKTREALQSFGAGGREVASSALAIELDMIADKEKQTLYRVMRDFVKSGEIMRVRRGVYIYNFKNKPPELQEIMWRYLRAKKIVTIEDLQVISNASRDYTAEWVQMLVKREIARRIRVGNNWKYQLINDPVIMPVNEENRKKLRGLRKQKKREALRALAAVDIAIREAQKKILEIHD